MSEENKALCRRFYAEVMSQGNVNLIDELCSADFVDHEQFPDVSSGVEGVKQFATMFRAAFPDLSFSVDDMVAEGDKVAVRGTMRGTHKGEFMGIAATGKQIEVPTIDFIRFASGKAAEHWGVTDQATMMQQLGVMPEGAPTS